MIITNSLIKLAEILKGNYVENITVVLNMEK